MRRLPATLLAAAAFFAALAVSAVFVVFAASGCRDGKHAQAPHPRIVSLSPALTSILFQTSLGDHVVGVTQFCIVPEGKTCPVVGSLLEVNVEAVLAVEPDVILVEGQGSEARRKAFEKIRQIRPGVQIERFHMDTLADLGSAIRRIGSIGRREAAAAEMIERFDARLEAVRKRVAGLPRPKVLFTNGHRRPFVAGPDNFTDEMIRIAGGTNCGAEVPGTQRWRFTGIEGVLSAAPDVLICLVDPGQGDAAREFWLGLRDLPAARRKQVHIVTDRRWTIPSTYLAELTAQLAEMIHPASAPAGATTQPGQGGGGS